MLNIYYGRESVDKDKFIYDRISGETALLVPDQYTLEAEKDILKRTERKGLLDVEILGFSRLSDRVLSECGRYPEVPINKYGRYMLLVKILQDVNERLTVYQNMYRRKSFIEMTNDFLAQIRQSNVSAEDLRKIRDELSKESLLKKKLSDICIIYEEYESCIAGKYMDTEDSITFTAGKLGESTYVAEREFWISGFDSFTPKNLDIIGGLIRHARNVNIVLTYDSGSRDEHLFSLTGSLIALLKEKAAEEDSLCSVSKIEGYEVVRPEGLKTLERELYAIPVLNSSNSEGITICSAAGIHQEIETAASFINGLVRDEEYRYSDIAVICNSIEKNEAGIRMVFGRFGIPVFIDSKRRIAANPLIIYLMSYIGLAIDGIRSSDMLKMIKTGYCGFEQKTCDELENYVIENRIRKNGWKKQFSKVRKNHEEMLPLIEELRKILMEEIETLASRMEQCRSIHEGVEAILDHMLHEVFIVDRINEKVTLQNDAGFAEEAQITVQAWNVFQDILEQIDQILGDEEGLLDVIPDMIQAGIDEAEAGVLPPVVDGISLGTAQRSRIASARAIVVIGADEGVLPQSGGMETLLNDDELVLLENEAGISVARTDQVRRNEENLGIYRTFSRASEHLWIGTAMADEKGDKVKPSPVINTMLRIFDNLKVQSDMHENPCDDRLFAGRTCTADNMTAALREYLDGGELDDRWKEVMGWFRENDADTLDRIERGLFYSPRKARMEKDIVRKLFSKPDGEYSLSPSELEKYAKCPFAHFMNYGLNPEERRVVEMAPREIGDVYHETFMKLAQTLTAPGIPLTAEDSGWMTITRDEFDEIVDSITDEVIKEYEEGFLLDNPEERYRAGRLKELAREIGWILVSHVRAGDIKEAKFEAFFGRNGDIPPVVFRSEGETVYIEGIIDRIDILGNDRVKIIDYKTGEAAFSEAEAKSGWKLQLMIYLKAGMQYGQERKPAGVFYFHVQEPEEDMTSKEREKMTEIIRDEIYKSFKLDGAIIDEEDVIPSIAGEFSGYSKIAPVKWSKKDEMYVSPGTNKKVFTDSEFEEFQNDVNETLQKLCDGIVSGDIDIRPKHKIKGRGACDYCDFSGICGFETSFEECSFEWID